MGAKNDVIETKRSSVARDGVAPSRQKRSSRAVGRPMTASEIRRAEDEADMKVALAALKEPHTATLEEVKAKLGL